MEFGRRVAARRGPLIIVAILLIAIASGILAVWYNAQSMRRPLAYWGIEPSKLIKNAPLVTAIRLGPTGMGVTSLPPQRADTDAATDQVTRDGTTWLVDQRRDATHSRGLSNLRHMLLQDQAYVWDAEEGAGPQWLFVLEFHDADGAANVWFAPREMRVGREGTVASLQLDPGGARELLSFFREQFETPAPPQTEAQ